MSGRLTTETKMKKQELFKMFLDLTKRVEQLEGIRNKYPITSVPYGNVNWCSCPIGTICGKVDCPRSMKITCINESNGEPGIAYKNTSSTNTYDARGIQEPLKNTSDTINAGNVKAEVSYTEDDMADIGIINIVPPNSNTQF